MREDGLLPPVDEREHEWLRPSFSEYPAEQRTALAFGWIRDIMQANAVVWPAADGGQPRRPPDEHLLDQLVRAHVCFDGPAELLAEVELRPHADTVGAVRRLRDCATCGAQEGGRYDSPRRSHPEGGWRFMCPRCYGRDGTGTLGSGHGQYLALHSEIGPELRAAFTRAKAYWADRGFTVPAHDPWD